MLLRLIPHRAGSSRREDDWWATVDHDSIGGRVVVMSIRWRLTESAMSVRLADKNVVDSNETNGWLIQPFVHGAGGLGRVANQSCSRRDEPGTVSDKR